MSRPLSLKALRSKRELWLTYNSKRIKLIDIKNIKIRYTLQRSRYNTRYAAVVDT